MAPTMTKPLTINWLPSPLELTTWARPTVPPAPVTLITCTLLAAPAATIACCSDREVWSQPPPGAAGAMILMSANCATADVAMTANKPAAIVPEISLLKRDIEAPPLSQHAFGRFREPATTFDCGDTVAPLPVPVNRVRLGFLAHAISKSGYRFCVR